VFGVSDGLVTNMSLVLGMAGANPGGAIVRLAGVAGLVAGSFSMAAGEYLSMTAQRELMQRELDVERRALERHPKGETAELRGMYVGAAPARGDGCRGGRHLRGGTRHRLGSQLRPAAGPRVNRPV